MVILMSFWGPVDEVTGGHGHCDVLQEARCEISLLGTDQDRKYQGYYQDENQSSKPEMLFGSPVPLGVTAAWGLLPEGGYCRPIHIRIVRVTTWGY